MECGCEKKKIRDQDEQKKLINRLNRIEGQIRGIRNMVENNAYCVDIMTQTAAANAALQSFNRELLDAHIRTCVAENIREGNDGIIDELIDTLRRITR